jgi:hypothetical protein
MKCPHCLVEFHPTLQWRPLGRDIEGLWAIEQYECPNPDCKRLVLYLVCGTPAAPRGAFQGYHHIEKRVLVNPKGSTRPPVPPDVPARFAGDYTEACIVLPDSPKASAALSRRCLQDLLREKGAVKPSHLADEIQQVLDSGQLPSHIAEAIDAVRNTGNFAAHPMKSERTGEILPVEPGEAEWNLDVLQTLFDFYFVQPALLKKKRAALDAKLAEAGKPPMK